MAHGLVQLEFPLAVALVRAQARFELAKGQADVFAAVGEVHVVQGVEGIFEFIEAFAEAHARQVAVANAHVRLAPGFAHAKADLAAVADLPAHVQTEAIAFQAVFGDGVVIQDQLDVLRLGPDVGGHKVA